MFKAPSSPPHGSGRHKDLALAPRKADSQSCAVDGVANRQTSAKFADTLVHARYADTDRRRVPPICAESDPIVADH